MRRRLFTAFSALSLLLLAALIVFWVRSYSRGDQVGYRATGFVTASGVPTAWYEKVALASYTGRLSLTRQAWHSPGSPDGSGWFFEGRQHRPTYDMDGGLAGFEYRRVTAPGRWLWEIRMPMWAAASVLAAAPAMQLILWRKRRRSRSAGLCGGCGYDLRASKGRCPECGMAIAGSGA